MGCCFAGRCAVPRVGWCGKQVAAPGWVDTWWHMLSPSLGCPQLTAGCLSHPCSRASDRSEVRECGDCVGFDVISEGAAALVLCRGQRWCVMPGAQGAGPALQTCLPPPRPLEVPVARCLLVSPSSPRTSGASLRALGSRRPWAAAPWWIFVL